jgi:hypothetical protein
MDAQQRLTKWDEWEIGAHYERIKGGIALGRYRCVEVNRKEGWVRMQVAAPGSTTDSDIVRNWNWQKRYQKIT